MERPLAGLGSVPEIPAGFIDILGIAPGYQGLGLGPLLLRRAFAGFAAAGLNTAQLGVASDNPRALRLYDRAAMTVRFRADMLERAIESSSADPV